MENSPQSLNQLNNLIQKLETNTGGESTEVVASKETKKKIEVKSEVKSEVQKQVKEEAQNQEKTEEVKQPKKKKQKKENDKKPEKKKQQEKKDDGPALFAQLDIRVSQMVECWKHPESENLYCQKILVCGEVREIASGLQKFVELDKMKGKVLVMANLKPRPLAGFSSNGMVVCASSKDHTQVSLIIPEGELGERVFLEGAQQLFTQGDILPVVNPKRKIVEKCLEHFATDGQGFVTWKGIRARTKAGYLRSDLFNGNVA